MSKAILNPGKVAVKEYWENNVCGTQVAQQETQKYTREYFSAIEDRRYSIEPEVFAFAQFSRHHGEKILEVGVGPGTDFVQWVRAGTKAYGVDLTEHGIEHVKQRLKLFGLCAEEVRMADCESLPYPDNSFDLVYSWGVIHHTTDTALALKEIIRVLRPGGRGKIMVYNRYSLRSFYRWVEVALLKGRPWKSFSWCFANHHESPGTKAYSRKEIQEMLSGKPAEHIKIKPVLTFWDTMGPGGNLLARLLGPNRVGLFMTIEFTKQHCELIENSLQ